MCVNVIPLSFGPSQIDSYSLVPILIHSFIHSIGFRLQGKRLRKETGFSGSTILF